ncbi:MAG: hypothetical protein Q9222_005950, partial [Ikaeria aurantiellina]
MRAYRFGSNHDHDRDEIDSDDLEKILGRLSNLHHFTWDVNRDIPTSVILRLEQHWPDVHLSIGDHDRATTDFRALTSPLLQSMSFCILNHTATTTATHQLEQYSKLPELRDILLKVPNLRKLDIKFVYNWIPRRVNWSGHLANPRLLNLPLEPLDRLPTLTDLTFSGPPETYEFTLEHYLGFSCPQFFFEEIGPQLENLESLTMGIRIGNRRYTHWPQGPLTCSDMSTVYRFLEQVPYLHELRITDLGVAPAYHAPFILETQTSLQVLSYHASLDRSGRKRRDPYTLTTAGLLALKSRFVDLSHLEIDLPLSDGKW